MTRTSTTGRFPALAKAVHDSTDVDAETTFAIGLDWILDASSPDRRPYTAPSIADKSFVDGSKAPDSDPPPTTCSACGKHMRFG